MFNWNDVLVEAQRRQDVTAKAEANRLARQAASKNGSWAATLGSRMVAWGTRLQMRDANVNRKPVAVQGKLDVGSC